MESPKSYAAKLLQSKQSTRQKLIVFGCLALAVVIITTTVLALHAQAMNYTRRVLECAYEVHEHKLEECGAPDARTCGLADYVVHVHNGDCYDEYGALVCPLKEEPEHKHTDACYEEQKVLTCGQDGVTEEEAAALIALYEPDHVHTEDCFVPGERVLACGQEEREAHAHTEACFGPGEPVRTCGQEERAAHQHGDGCYTTGEPVLNCTDEEHDHSDACYTPGERVLTCGQAEDEGHTHTDGCYSEGDPVLVCGQDEHDAHAHTDDCYVEGDPVAACNKGEAAPVSIPAHTHTEECYTTAEELTCGKLELHTHEDECYDIIKPEDPAYQSYKEAYPEEVSENKEIRILKCEIPQLEEHVHGPECFTEVELSPDEIAALKAQEMGIELRDVQTVYEDADVRVTVDYDTLSLVPQPAEVALVNAATPLPEPTPNPLLAVDATEPEAADDAVLPEAEGEPADAADAEPAAEPAPEAAEPAPEAAPEAAAPEVQPAVSENEPAAEPAAVSSEAPEVVRAGLMAEGREWLPAATVTYTVQYLDNGMPVGEAVQYAYTPGGEMPTFPRSIARFYRECRTDDFIVTARYTEFAQIPAEAELRASLISDEEQVAAYESAYKEALNTNKAQMLSLLDIGFWMDDEEVQPAAPVSITVQMLGEDGLPAGAPLAIVHFGEQTEVLAATSDDAGVAAFNMNSFSPVGIGQVPDADEEGRALLNDAVNGTFEWTDPNGLYHVTFQINGVVAPKAVTPEEPEDSEEDITAPEEGEDAQAPSEEEAAAGEAENEDGEEAAAPEADTDTENESAEIPLANAALIEFKVEQLGEDDEAFEAYAEAAEENVSDLMNLDVMRYTLIYAGVEMDLTNCEITATIKPTMQLQELAEIYTEENPVDNGDDDGDGYVEGADGETLLPAPQMQRRMLMSVMAPAAEEPVALVDEVVLDGADASETEQIVAVSDASMINEIADPANEAPAADEDIPGVEANAAMMAVSDQEIVTVLQLAGEPVAYAAQASTFALSSGPEDNPPYQVEYYAWLQVLPDEKPEGKNVHELPIIDTSKKQDGKGGNLPGNTATQTTRDIYVNYTRGGEYGNVIYENKLTEVYTKNSCEYFKQPGIRYAEKLIDNTGYTLKQIWVSNDKGTTWETYGEWPKINGENVGERPDHLVSVSQLHFTNREVKASDLPAGVSMDNFIRIKENSLIRFVYEVTTGTPTNAVNFYDYDITDDGTTTNSSKAALWTSNQQSVRNGAHGINSNSNYGNNTSDARFAFGNANSGTGLAAVERWNGHNLNAYNTSTNNRGKNVYMGCTFGLVQDKLSSDNRLQFSSGVVAPDLFSANDVKGKYPVNGLQLQFIREGDTYTLSAVTGTSTDELEKFGNPWLYDGINKGVIWTNDFWPMDAYTHKDGLTGLGHPGEDEKHGPFKGYTGLCPAPNGHTVDLDYYPPSDDGIAHNSMFGMHFVLDFSLDKDYIGPLDYCFFGDDDLWIYLQELDAKGNPKANTSKLICDIGGVHSTVGEYVNLWDWIKQGTSGNYRLYFFYTERGLSGSTCWMRFTLPSVTSVTPEEGRKDYGSLRIEKTVERAVNNGNYGTTLADNGEEYQFILNLYDANGQRLFDDYTYTKYQVNKNGPDKELGTQLIIWNGAEFNLKDNEYIVINNIPVGARYTVTELLPREEAYTITDWDGLHLDPAITVPASKYAYTVKDVKLDKNGYAVFTGTIPSGDKPENRVASVKITNQYVIYSLPETGGVTAEWYVVGGAALVLAAAAVIRKRRKKARA